MPEPVPSRPARLVSLDAFRGISILGMILVNNPGTWSAVYAPLRHAEWHGWTPTDLVFPFFLFIVGVAIPLAFRSRMARGVSRGALARKALKRSAVLFGIGVALAAFPFVTFEDGVALKSLGELRVLGVLQRIALCYLGAALLALYAPARVQWGLAAAILAGYALALTLVPVPGFGPGRLDVPEGTLAAFVDRAALGTSHLWKGAGYQWDPEGLLSTLPALVTTLIGVWAGRLFLRAEVSPPERAAWLLGAGCVAMAAGTAWGWGFPINKALWTPPYVLLTGGQALAGLGLCYGLADVLGKQRWTFPFRVYGVNALLVFVGSAVVARTLYLIQVPGPDGAPIALQAWIFRTVFLPLASPVNASLLYALVWVGLWFGVLWLLWRRGIVWKV